MTDILKRLRETRTGKTTSPDWPYGLLLDAADEIENLRSDVDFFMFLLGLTNDDPTDANDTNGHPKGTS